MIDRLIEDERGRDRLLAFISRRALPFRASIVDGRPRSYDQNRLQWQWASEAASQLEDTSVRELQREWKLRFGVPVLIGEDPSFADLWCEIERHMPYTIRLRLMEHFDVTSKLTVKGFATMLDDIFQCYTVEHGIELSDPEEKHFGKIGSRVDRGGTGSSDPPAGTKKGCEAPAGPVRGLYAGLQREAQTGDAPRTTSGDRGGREQGE